MEWMRFEVASQERFVQRAALEEMFAEFSPTQLMQLPKLNKSNKQRQLQQQQQQQQREMGPILRKDQLPNMNATEFGVPGLVQSQLEVCIDV